jgi:Rps23 Pro-64 3,4-dihydroxylase Tpa1-like proline 4-hydroxylase
MMEQFNSNHFLIVDDFLEEDDIYALEQEANSVPDRQWKSFKRNNTQFKECLDLEVLPECTQLLEKLHSAKFLRWLSSVTGIEKLLPDPYLIGGGYLKSDRNDMLGSHLDFNWNDTIKMYRRLTLTIYLTSNWQSEWGGNLCFFDEQNQNKIAEIEYKYNRAVLWKDRELNFHGYPDPLTCPDSVSRKAFLLFYYTNETSSPLESNPPHRSLYWYDRDNNSPYDIRQ